MLNAADKQVLCMMPKQRSYTTTFKLKAIEVAEKKSKEAAARELKVDPKRIREWCMKKEELTFFANKEVDKEASKWQKKEAK